MRLYSSPTTPFGRKVMVLLHENSLLGDVAVTDAAGSPLNSSAMPVAQNPLGKIPVLERDDGPVAAAAAGRDEADDGEREGS